MSNTPHSPQIEQIPNLFDHIPPYSLRRVLYRVFRGVVLLVAWVVALCLLLGTLLRLFFHDGTVLLTWFNAFTLYVYLPAYVCFGIAWWYRRKYLLWIALAVIGFHLWWNVPSFLFGGQEQEFTTQPDAGSAPCQIRVYFHNVWGRSHAYDETIAEIYQNDPDVVVLAEWTSNWKRAAIERGLIAKYPYYNTGKKSFLGVMIYSKLPIHDLGYLEPVGWRPAANVTIDVDGKQLQVLGVHCPGPTYPDSSDYSRYHQALVKAIKKTADNVIVIGDFNMTQHARWYPIMTQGRMRNAHQSCGRGYAVTWPNGKHWLPPIRIDHAFLSDTVICRSIREGQGICSDHKPLIVDLEIR